MSERGNRGGQTTHRLRWVDVDQRSWSVELSSQRLVLQSGDDVIDLPADSWPADLYVVEHGEGCIVRIETFERSVRFLLSAKDAASLRTQMGAPRLRQRTAVADEEPSRVEPLLWPKVSPLAVWALICSSLVFVPVLGLLPGAATVILLILHRARVRKTRANSHSRVMCIAAFVFLVAGLCVSALSTIGILVNVPAALERMEMESVSRAVAPVRDADAPRSTEGLRQIAISRSDSLMPGVCNVPVSPRGLKPAARDTRTEHALVGRASMLGQSFWQRHHNWGMIAAGLVVIILSLSVHECGHAITAWWLGDDFARRIGRVTLRPLAHIDPFGTILLPLILFMLNVGVFGWARPVPVRAENLRRPRRDHILVSLAGPGANLLLASASMALMLGLGCVVSLTVPGAEVNNFAIPAFTEPVRASGFPLAFLFGPLCTILQLSFLLNVFLAFFNLIPVPPLDGSWVLEHMFPRTLGPVYAKIRPLGFILFLVLIYTGLFQYLLIPAFMVLLPGIGLLAFSTGFA